MPTTIAPPEVNTKPKGSHDSSGGGFDGGGGRGDDSNRWGDFGGSERQTPIDAYRLAMWLALASIVMLFAGLSSAYVFRMGASPDWRSISIPAFLLPNSCLLLASSLTLELFRRGLKNGLDSKTRLWVALTNSAGRWFSGGTSLDLEGSVCTGHLSQLKPSQFVLLLDDGDPRSPPGRRCDCPAGSFLESLAPRSCDAGPHNVFGFDRHLLAFHGRLVDLSLSTVIPLEVAGWPMCVQRS